MVEPIHKSKDYAAITSKAQLQRMVDKLIADGKPIGFDLETGYHGPDVKKRAVDHYNANQFVVGFSFTNDPGWARYVPIRHDEGGNIDATPAEVWEIMRPLLTKCHIIAHNAKFELAAVRKAGGYVIGSDGGKLTCTMLDTSIMGLVPDGMRTMIALKSVVLAYFGHAMMHIEELWPDMPKNRAPSLRFNTLPVSAAVVAYACEDAAWVLPLYDIVTVQALEERPFMHALEHQIMMLMEEVELYGVAIDWDGIELAYAQAQTFAPVMEAFVKEELGKLAGRDLSDLNLNSALQMKKLLFKEIGMLTTRLTKKAQEDGGEMEDWQKMSSDKKALVALAEEYEAVRFLLQYREVKNLLNRLKKWMTEYHDTFDGRVHANYKQAGAEGSAGDTSGAAAPGSGRFSATEPAIQQLRKEDWIWLSEKVDFDYTKRDNKAKLAEFKQGKVNGHHFYTGNFRDFIVAAPGKYLLTYDYSQVELRMLAGASQEPTLLEAFYNEDDVHTLTAAMMLGKDPADIDPKTERPIGKTFNFALMYGMGAKSLGEQLGFSLEYAKELYNQYFEKFSNVAAWKTRTENLGAQRGYAETIFGRKIPVWELKSPKSNLRAHGMRLLINAPIQGAAADYMKIAMFRATAELRNRGWWGTKVCIIMNQHDALTFEVDDSIDPNELRDILQPRVVFGSEISRPLEGYPPIRADWELGQRWGSSKAWGANQKVALNAETGLWEIQPEPELSRFQIGIGYTPTESEFKKFVSTLKAQPGSTLCRFTCPEADIEFPFTSMVTKSNSKDLKNLFKNAKIEVS